MNVYPIEAGNFKLDGGAMFGVVPKSLWTKTNPADADNMIEMSSRCMLVESSDKLILVDTGMGDKQSEKFFKYYKRWGSDNLVKSINSAGFSIDDVTDVLLTHLHFDHCGGAVAWDSSKEAYDVLFKNANYWSNEKHWDWATNPNPREKASFLDENLFPIKESGQLKFIRNISKGFNYCEELGLEILCVDGHTEKQMIPIINFKGQKIAFAADLIPTAGHVPLPYIPGYDIRPLTSLREKESFLNFCNDNNVLLFFEHDAFEELGLVHQTERGIRLKSTLKLLDL